MPNHKINDFEDIKDIIYESDKTFVLLDYDINTGYRLRPKADGEIAQNSFFTAITTYISANSLNVIVEF